MLRSKIDCEVPVQSVGHSGLDCCKANSAIIGEVPAPLTQGRAYLCISISRIRISHPPARDPSERRVATGRTFSVALSPRRLRGFGTRPQRRFSVQRVIEEL